MSDTRIIKKYANRRLYDMDSKKYITLSDVRQLVCDDIDFRVIDAETENDITQSTLIQILAEGETGPAPLFTNTLLRNFIRFYDQKSSKLLSQYLEQAMKAFNQQQEFVKGSLSAYQQFLKSYMKDK